jgi:hypothetical protein
MIIEVGATYETADGIRWTVLSVDGSRIAPVEAGRWMGKRYSTRTFQRDGRYWADRSDNWDLIRRVEATCESI